jgi:hypothetical protein
MKRIAGNAAGIAVWRHHSALPVAAEIRALQQPPIASPPVDRGTTKSWLSPRA